MSVRRTRTLAVLAAAAALPAAALVATPAGAAALPPGCTAVTTTVASCTATFSAVGFAVSFPLPAGTVAGSVTAAAVGAPGGSSGAFAGGRGAIMSGAIPSADADSTLFIAVGGRGADGGFNGGGAGDAPGGNGGGASDIRLDSSALVDRVLIAGGGGGAAGTAAGEDAGTGDYDSGSIGNGDAGTTGGGGGGGGFYGGSGGFGFQGSGGTSYADGTMIVTPSTWDDSGVPSVSVTYRIYSAPAITIVGQPSGPVARPQRISCTAVDLVVSGPVGCQVQIWQVGRRVQYVASATDSLGNEGTVNGHYRVLGKPAMTIPDATWTSSGYVVKRAQGFTVRVVAMRRPVLLRPTDVSELPSQRFPLRFVRSGTQSGTPVWTASIKILKRGHWYVGARRTGTTPVPLLVRPLRVR